MASPEHTPEGDPNVEALCDVVFRNPSVFGRVIQIATFWGGSMPDRFDAPHAEETLRKLQLEMFTTWLMLPLKLQKADIAVHLNRLDAADRSFELNNLLEVAENALPPAIKPHERQLFLEDLKIVQALVHYDL